MVVLIFDNRNIGGSTIPEARKDDEYTVNDMAGDVIALVKVRYCSFKSRREEYNVNCCFDYLESGLERDRSTWFFNGKLDTDSSFQYNSY